MMMHRNQSVNVHQFAMTPRAEIPRSTFLIENAHKTTFDAGYLIPVYIEEMLPGDTFQVQMTAFARLATPIFPVMDNLYLDTFFFYVPKRLLWINWVRFMGEQINPTDSISYVIPQIVSPAGGYGVGTIFDYFGLPTVGQVSAGLTVSVNTLPLRAYNLIWNQWFRDENLQVSLEARTDDGPDLPSYYALRRRGKRPDYFTTALPWPQKGATPVSLPLGLSAPIRSLNAPFNAYIAGAGPTGLAGTGGAGGGITQVGATGGPGGLTFGPSGTLIGSMYADLSGATAATINQLRQAFQIQKLLERDARGGTRYVEIILSHFGVRSPDFRLDRPEYIGGGSTPIQLSPVAQTSGSGITGGTTPLGNLSAIGTSLGRHGFTYSATEHGYVIGLVQVRADLTYQQGLRRLWSRSTRYDFYFPAFAMLGEQAILNKEIYASGVTATDNGVFGYQERWAEYRYSPSMVSSLFRSTSAGTIDAWHLAQRFLTLPVLGPTFIEDNPPLSRILAVGTGANGQQIIFDSFFRNKATRPLPVRSVPGLIDHF